MSPLTQPAAAPSHARSVDLEVPLPPEPGCRQGLPHPDASAAAEIAALLADTTRAGIIELLEAGPYCVCEIAEALGERANNVSNHLARLRAAGLVSAVRHGADARWVYYERDEPGCAAALATVRTLLEPHH